MADDKLDRTRFFGEITGPIVPCFEQDGKYYDGSDERVVEVDGVWIRPLIPETILEPVVESEVAPSTPGPEPAPATRSSLFGGPPAPPPIEPAKEAERPPVDTEALAAKSARIVLETIPSLSDDELRLLLINEQISKGRVGVIRAVQEEQAKR